MGQEGRDYFENPVGDTVDGGSQLRAGAQDLRKTPRRRAGDRWLDGGALTPGAKEVIAKALAYAETNVQVSLDYPQSLLHAKDLPRG